MESPDDIVAASSPGVGRRRALLAGGLLGAAGVGGLTGFAAADRTTILGASAGRLEYGPGPSGHDDHRRLQAAVDALAVGGGMLILRAGSYRLGSTLDVPPGVHLAGAGGFPISERSGTAILCTSVDAGLHFRGGSNGARDLVVFANHVGRRRAITDAAAITVGGIGTGDAGADCYFANVAVGNAVGVGWLIQGTQNSTFVNCRVQLALGDGLVVDYSAGGLLFERVESGGNAGASLRVHQSRRAATGAQAVPDDNTFVACVFEQRVGPGPCVSLDQADVTTFLHCAFAGRPGRVVTADASALVEIRTGRVDFYSPVVYLQGSTRSAFGLRAEGSTRATAVIAGLASISGGAGAFVDVDDGATAHVTGVVLGLAADDPGSATTLRSTRTTVDSVQTPGQSPRSRTATAAGGTLRLDVADTDTLVVRLDGRDVTGLTLTGAAAGQKVSLVFVQGPRTARVTLPGKAEGFAWSGGDRGIPTVRTAGGYLAVQLLAVTDGWVELSRAGTDLSA